jgi:hypothetical protein
LAKCRLELGALTDRLARALTTVAQRRPGEAEMIAALLDEPAREPEIARKASRADASC